MEFYLLPDDCTTSLEKSELALQIGLNNDYDGNLPGMVYKAKRRVETKNSCSSIYT